LQRCMLASQNLQRRGSVFCYDDLMAAPMLAQSALDRLCCYVIVVDQQYAEWNAVGQGSFSVERGQRTRNVVPRTPSFDSTTIWPPCDSTSRLLSARPIPECTRLPAVSD
jgi:hypothetical protein